MEISSDTKIAALLKENPQALDAIISISAHYKKLQNPLLRKILAARVSIADAAKVGGVTIEAFYNKLLPLGFSVKKHQPSPQYAKVKNVEGKVLSYDVILDVRDDLKKGKDPFSRILDALKKLPKNNTLLLVNSFVPAPLVKILEKKGFEVFCYEEEPKLVKTYISKKHDKDIVVEADTDRCETIQTLKNTFGDNIKVINVKNLEMPGPMVKILEEAKSLPSGHALHVLHKKVPVYLLPELQDLGFEAYIEEKSENDVELLVYRKRS